MTHRPIGWRSVVTRNGEVAFRVIDGETVMMSLQAGKYYSLDQVGTRVWELLEQPMTVEAICTALLEEFEVDRETCQRDVVQFLEMLAADELVRVGDAPAP